MALKGLLISSAKNYLYVFFWHRRSGGPIATFQNCTFLDFTQRADFYIAKGGILQFIFIGAMSIFNAPRL